MELPHRTFSQLPQPQGEGPCSESLSKDGPLLRLLIVPFVILLCTPYGTAYFTYIIFLSPQDRSARHMLCPLTDGEIELQ